MSEPQAGNDGGLIAELARFFGGGTAYNVANFVLALAGAALGVFAIWIAVVQIRKTRQAADAARDATIQTRSQLVLVTQYITLQRLCALAAEAKVAATAGDATTVRVRLDDLRLGIVELRESGSQSTEEQTAWQGMLTMLASAKSSFTGSKNGTAKQKAERLLGDIVGVQEALHAKAAVQSRALGVADGTVQ